jgi:hypothetical protein
LERVELDVALAGRGSRPPRTTPWPEQVEPEPEARHLRREHQAGSTPPNSARTTSRAVGLDRDRRTKRAREVESFGADVDGDHAIAERPRDLYAVVTEPTRGAYHRDRPTGQHVVLEQSLDRAIRGEAATRERRFVITNGVGQLHQARCEHREVLGERAHDSLALRAVPGLSGEAPPARAAPIATSCAAEPRMPVADLHGLLRAGADASTTPIASCRSDRRPHARPAAAPLCRSE